LTGPGVPGLAPAGGSPAGTRKVFHGLLDFFHLLPAEIEILVLFNNQPGQCQVTPDRNQSNLL